VVQDWAAEVMVEGWGAWVADAEEVETAECLEGLEVA
jgi:hypothetical protein